VQARAGIEVSVTVTSAYSRVRIT